MSTWAASGLSMFRWLAISETLDNVSSERGGAGWAEASAQRGPRPPDDGFSSLRPIWAQRMAALVSAGGLVAASATTQAKDFQVEVFSDAASMLLACGAQPPACAFIDTRVQDIAVSPAVRALIDRAAIPVFIGVWDDEQSKRIAVEALQAGASGLVGMPASESDLRTAMRISGGRANAGLTKVTVGSVVAFKESRAVWVRDVQFHLAEIEFGLLWCLLRAFPRPVSLADLAQGCGEFAPCKPPALKARVSRLRRKLEAAVPGSGVVLTSVPGTGYVTREFN